MLYQDSFTAEVMIKFLERLVRDADKKVYFR